MNHVAIDLHDEYSQICVMSEKREVLTEAKVRTTRAGLGDFFRNRERCLVVFEAGPHGLWVGELLKELGHDTFACHPRRVRLIAESRNKNDRVDAETLARLSLSDLELLKPIQQRSRQTFDERTVVRTRAALVETQKQLRTMLRGMVKPFGVRVAAGKARALRELAQVELPKFARTSVDAVLRTLDTVAAEIRGLDQNIEQLTTDHHVVKRLQTIPGVGPLVGIAYVHAIEDPARFRSIDVGAFLGLTPANRSSAGKKLSAGDRARPGDPYVRSLLIQASWTLMNSRSESELARWGRALVARIGAKKAAVALARKLAVLMQLLWLRDEDFSPRGKRHVELATS
ncbi:MAG TPA: IS110 family transposase [Gemmatimonadaceae bacterium]|nr:IS110 family transposase [Gemmatimonadaceae bacterium]